jgi:hypothetical protein
METHTKIELIITGVKKFITFGPSTKIDPNNERNPHSLLKLAGEEPWGLTFY